MQWWAVGPSLHPAGCQEPHCQCMFKVTQKLKHKEVRASLVNSKLTEDGTSESYLMGRRNGVGRTEKDHMAEELTSKESETRTRRLLRATPPNQPAETIYKEVRTLWDATYALAHPMVSPHCETGPLKGDVYFINTWSLLHAAACPKTHYSSAHALVPSICPLHAIPCNPTSSSVRFQPQYLLQGEMSISLDGASPS